MWQQLSFMALVAIVFPLGAQPAGPFTSKPPQLVDVVLTDKSKVRFQILEEKLQLKTEYGMLEIPMKDVVSIKIGLRISEAEEKIIANAIADLGNAEFRTREGAGKLLKEFREKSLPALKVALNHEDGEISKRAEEILFQMENLIPEERQQLPPYDVVTTKTSKIAGVLQKDTIQAKSIALGEVTLKLDFVDLLDTGNREEENLAKLAEPAPTTLTTHQQHVGKTFVFKVTGKLEGGSVWGTDFYTLDSDLARAAVHAGLVKPGQTKIIKVAILGPSVNFQGTERNRIVSSPYQSYPGAYRFVK
ncbi:MAG: LCCL domain-containing protein [Zavarzinella sp.]